MLRIMTIIGVLLSVAWAARGAQIEPMVIIESHMSDPTKDYPHDSTQDFFGVGATIFMGKHRAFEADLALGRRAINCGVPACSFRDTGAHAEVKWYPWRHRSD